MNIILNENEWAEEMILSRSLGNKPYRTLSRVARYYIDKGYSKEKTERLLDNFIIQCDPTASMPKWSNLINHAMRRALKYSAINIDYIRVTKDEIDIISTVQGVQAKRLAFTLLCLAKYWNAVNPQGDYWVNTKDSEIMRMANINTSIKRQSFIYKALKDKGLIQFSKKVDNTNIRVLFAKEGDTALKISDFRNLGYQYLKYLGEPYFECCNCNITTKYNNPEKGRKQMYCKECATAIATQQRVNSVMRQRGKIG